MTGYQHTTPATGGASATSPASAARSPPPDAPHTSSRAGSVPSSRGVVDEPPQRLHDVVALGREQGLPAEAVVGRGDDEPGVDDPLEEATAPPASLPGRPAAMAHPPAPTVEVDDERGSRGGVASPR